ncbi:MAG: GNAT family N-acetyltransferase [Aeromicrobium sp.]|uniref:GNAT family N-acetyltransferase n=1 Tax=Aeromicrobium sp. TaxID=1871063 RepID=UPI00262A5155|nr:GNAT family N-acetyltransferase [Aeromicrobium sp.]MDF1704604.1 GNAT family N-acetyltransferase [Aeromicrobium sp.]
MIPVALVEVAADDPVVQRMRQAMGEEMAALYGRPRHASPAEDIDPGSVVVTLLARQGDLPVGTGALRRLGPDLEVKRMYVPPAGRGRGLGRLLLENLEERARHAGAPRLLLHTGSRQESALALYRASGYTEVPVFEPYLSVPDSVCFAKHLAADGAP